MYPLSVLFEVTPDSLAADSAADRAVPNAVAAHSWAPEHAESDGQYGLPDGTGFVRLRMRRSRVDCKR